MQKTRKTKEEETIMLVIRLPVQYSETKSKVKINMSCLNLKAEGSDLAECINELEEKICKLAEVQMLDFIWYDEQSTDDLSPVTPAIYSHEWDLFLDLIHNKENIFEEENSERKKRIESQNHLAVGK